jgi:deoxycytidylate deaminase
MTLRIDPQLLPSRTQAWWDRFYLNGAKWYASASKDPSTQVGAVVRLQRLPAQDCGPS